MSLESDPPKKFTLPPIPKEVAIGVVVFAVALIPSVYFYSQYRSARSKLADPTAAANTEVSTLVGEVGKLMALPEGEIPTVATVNDKEKLKNQPFFAKSENGDKVLIYTNNKKAILYRPSIAKIIDVAPINIGPTTATASAQVQPTEAPEKYTFTLLNGTSVVGLTKTYEEELVKKLPGATVIDRDNAVTTTYDSSVLIAGKTVNSAKADSIAKALGLQVSALPAGESTPSADFLIILGTDKK